MDASPLLAGSCSGFWAPMQLLVLYYKFASGVALYALALAAFVVNFLDASVLSPFVIC